MKDSGWMTGSEGISKRKRHWLGAGEKDYTYVHEEMFNINLVIQERGGIEKNKGFGILSFSPF